MQVTITPEMKQAAQSLHQRRVLANQSGAHLNAKSTVAEMAALAAMDRDFKLKDLKVAPKSLQFIPTDESGREVRVIFREKWPIRVYSYRLDSADLFVAVTQVEPDLLDVSGWLPREIVERAPVFWWEEDGVRTSYAHELESDLLFPLPDKFDFVDVCGYGDNAHIDQSYCGVWDHFKSAWECFGCDRFIYDEATRQSDKREQERRARKRDQVSAGAEESERKEVEHDGGVESELREQGGVGGDRPFAQGFFSDSDEP